MRFFRKREPADPFSAFSERYGVRLPRMEPEEAHVVLGVGLGASQEEISAAYRRLARIHHPDVAGDEERMKVINAAYRELRRSAGRSTPPQESL
jgi:DnaJ-domain-containing protein 1